MLLVDGGELVGEQLVENVDQFLVALHVGLLWLGCGYLPSSNRISAGKNQEQVRVAIPRVTCVVGLADVG